MVLCGFHLLANLFWFSLNTAPLPWDQAGHTLIALHHSYFFKSLLHQDLLSFLTISPYYPPLVHIIASFPILIFGNPIFVSSLTITFFFIASILLLYIYTNDIFKNRIISLLTAIIYSFTPIIYEHSRWFLLEIPLLTGILATLICFEKWEKTNKQTYWYGCILAFSLTVLIKWLAAIYLFPISIIFAYVSYNRLKKGELKINSLLIGGGIFLSIVLPWYITNLISLFKETQNTILPEVSDPQNFWSKSNFFFYLYQFVTFQVTLFFLFPALAGGEFLWVSQNKKRYFIFFYILFIYLAFTLIPNKDPRYTMPIILFNSMLIAFAFLELIKKIKTLGITLTILFLFYIITLYIILSFRPQTFHYQRAIHFPILGWIDYININDNLAHAYNNASWPQVAIHEAIAKDAQGKEVKVLVLVDQELFNLGNLLVTREINNFWNILSLPAPQRIDHTDQAAKKLLSEYDYVITARYQIGVPATRNIDVLKFLTNFINLHNTDWFLRLSEFTIPTNDTITIYKVNL